MKTYHNEANTGGITKIAMKNLLDFFEQSRQIHKIAKLQNSNFQSHTEAEILTVLFVGSEF